MFKLNLRIALRNLWKHKGYTLINVGGLAIGLASCMLLLLYVAYEWNYDRQFKNYDRTYVVYNNSVTPTQTFSWAWTPVPMADEIRTKIPGVAYASRSSYPKHQLISYQENNFKESILFADPDFLKILDFKVLKGNPDRLLRGVNSVVLTESLARKLFGNEDPLNKTVEVENGDPEKQGAKDVLKVEGVIADVPRNSSIQFTYLGSWKLFEQNSPWAKNLNWGNNSCLTLVQLKDKALFDQANGQIEGIYKRNMTGATNTALLHPLSKWHLYDKFENGRSVGGKIDQIRIFFTLAFCILLIACVNFMNLSTARSEKRAREVGVRKAIGSSRKLLISQFMIESILLSFIAMIVAFVLIEISLPYFNSLLNIKLTIHYSSWIFWVTLTGLTLLTGCIAGSYPAFYLSSFEPVRVLKGFSMNGSSTLSIRKVLVVFQFVFAVCLIICTFVIYQQLNYIKNKPAGFNKGGLIEIPIQGNLRNKVKLELLEERLLKSGAVSHVSYFSNSLNEGGNNTFAVDWTGKSPKEEVLFNYRSAGPDFIETIGTKLLAGHEFSKIHRDTTKVMINEAAVKVMGMKQPIGARFRWWGRPVEVIGVVKDFIMESPYQSAGPMLISDGDIYFKCVLIRLNPEQNLSSSIAKIDDLVKSVNPDFPVDRRFVSDDFELKFQNEQILGTLSNWFGGFAIFISCLGLLGLALFMAEQRKKEISIRKVLGASTMNILALLNKDFVKLVAVANLIAFPIAYIVIQKWLSAYEFRIGISFLPFTIAIVLSLLIAILTVSLQSVKVAQSNPIDALKHE